MLRPTRPCLSIWQGCLYLAVVMDLHARNIVGWSMKPTLARELVLDAVVMAVWRRNRICDRRQQITLDVMNVKR